MSFVTQLKVKYIDRKKRVIIEDFFYDDKDYGMIRIPAMTETDFASLGVLKTPKLHILYALLATYGDRASAIHDFLYQSGFFAPLADTEGLRPVTRKQADRIFYNALRAEGIARWRAWLFYGGVRIGGWIPWRKHRKGQV